MQGAWAGFAKDPISGPGWNRVSVGRNNRYLGVLGNAGDKKGTGVTVIDPTGLDARCALYTPLYAAATTRNSW
jgi:cholinesterase